MPWTHDWLVCPLCCGRAESVGFAHYCLHHQKSPTQLSLKESSHSCETRGSRVAAEVETKEAFGFKTSMSPLCVDPSMIS